MVDEPLDNPQLASALQLGRRAPVDLYCPACAYPLVQVEEVGLRQCPECGEVLDFDELRRLRREGQSLPAQWPLFWKIVWRPGRFFAGLKSPRYYVRIPGWSFDGNEYLGWSLAGGFLVGVTLAMAAAVSSGWACASFALPLIWVVTVLAANAAARRWVRWLLWRAGHGEAEYGARRIMFFASTVYVLTALDLCLFMAALAASIVCQEESVALALPIVFGLNIVLWPYWSWIIMLGFQAEMRGTDTMLAFWAFANPGLALALIGPLMLLLFAVLFYVG